ncbi:hypothetical protein PHMEG_00023819 [Phytophthora megakarya]|uniref:Uncharacterized protein n=1 Tax=Phytophthora megakarya TaxID=4795 RepID=A0A225VFG4_9STRA|nr:hypothetical protein PHMEG_00023819 [Phytophthora megakarya]
MGVSKLFRDIWNFMRRPFEDCTSCTDVLDPYYYSKTSPGVRRDPPKFDRACWENDLKYDFSLSRPPPSFQSPSDRRGYTLSGSSSFSDPLSYSEDEDRIEFLFYGGSEVLTPLSSERLVSGYRTDLISKPTKTTSQPQINHEIPCFFSPRDTPLRSPLTAPIYSPHLFKITEQRRNSKHRNWLHHR